MTKDESQQVHMNRLDRLYYETKYASKYGLIKQMEHDAIQLAVERDATLKYEPNPELCYSKKGFKQAQGAT